MLEVAGDLRRAPTKFENPEKDEYFFQVDRYKMSIVEKGTPYTEQIEVDEKQDFEIFRVPGHNDVDGADFYHDFKMVRLV